MRGRTQRLVLRDSGPRRLICVPFAGGSARSFTRLARELGEDWSVVAVQPPPPPGGHGRPPRPGDPEPLALTALAEDYLRVLDGDLHGPGLLLGHSLGAAVAHEMARLRGADWPLDLRVVLSAPPAMGAGGSLHELTDHQLLYTARQRGILPELPVSDDFVVRMLLPDFRRDLAVLRDGWHPAPVPASLALLGGTEDEACPPGTLTALAEQVGADSCGLVPGGHLYVVDRAAESAAALRAIDSGQSLLSPEAWRRASRRPA
ncbi:thioesterase II family protein [Streptomyces physcomitrii]|uniref:Thioesterase domain-containing protein n=1 Tax=Streptomyces physcomitrii TaxID=2724184 RepID=A0ABX1H2N1_9ACTN|nr:alpha/beta fold hydrolase [Streptomyces physcomitrii]NKI41524.1 hypothetical protein [Streptomyces physcomitrii]